MGGILNSLTRLKTGVKTRRVSSYDTTGGNRDWMTMEPGETAPLAVLEGAGVIRHIWCTFSSEDVMVRRSLVLRMYWNGEEAPSVEAPIGDFFGQGWGEAYDYAALPLCAAPSGGKALNCYFAMPFSAGARIELENQSELPLKSFFYCIDYEEHERLPDGTAMFHACWRREVTLPPADRAERERADMLNPSAAENYVFADIEGKGHFVGLNYFVDNPSPKWYGEGDDMWLVDGEKWPGSLHGTGTEDFFNTGWCPTTVYSHPFFGCARVPSHGYGWLGRTHCYRFFLQDPVYFEKSLHGSIEHGHANALMLDLCTVAYWYQTEPHKPFAPLLPAAGRQNMPKVGPYDVYRWWLAWREGTAAELGLDNLWGTEKLPRDE